MIHEVFPVGLLRCNCSVIGDEQTREAIVIDPGADIAKVEEVLERHSLRVTAIVVTHAHIDHIGGAAKLRELTGAPVWMNQADEKLAGNLPVQAEWLGVETPPNPGIDHAAAESDSLQIGAMRLDVIETPGHTEGSICLYAPAQKLLLAGDTLFRDSVGRTDLPGGDSRKIVQSIREKLFTLPDETLVIPGHGHSTTIGREKDVNPFVGASSRSSRS